MSRNGDRMNTKAPMRRKCQGRTKGILPRIRRQWNRTQEPIEVRVLSVVKIGVADTSD